METFHRGQPIIRQNDPSNNKFYVILRGSVSIVKANDTNVFQVVTAAKIETTLNIRGSTYETEESRKRTHKTQQTEIAEFINLVEEEEEEQVALTPDQLY